MDFKHYFRFFLAALVAPLILAGVIVNPVHAEIVWHWDDAFHLREQTKVRSWLGEVHLGVEAYVGEFPFDVHVHVHRRDNSSQPVPWANTDRRGRQSLHFYVDTSYPLQSFREDWTAPHEFSHLIIPYVGRSNAWFAEGFASYLQHSVMVQIGVIDAAEALRRRDGKMRKATDVLADVSEPLPDYMPTLRERRAYPTFYWGGAVYFERADAALHEQGSSLQAVLRKYLACCRMQRRSLEGLANVFDSVEGTELFRNELRRIQLTRGIPKRP